MQSHGRVSVAMLAVKVLLTLLFTLEHSVNMVVLGVASLLGGLMWFTLHVYFIPYHSVRF